jgi:hypothetical protein
MNKLCYRKEAAFKENLFLFWFLFCQYVVFLQAVSFLCGAFMHSFNWLVIVAVSFGGSCGWFFRQETRPFLKLN